MLGFINRFKSRNHRLILNFVHRMVGLCLPKDAQVYCSPVSNLSVYGPMILTGGMLPSITYHVWERPSYIKYSVSFSLTGKNSSQIHIQVNDGPWSPVSIKDKRIKPAIVLLQNFQRYFPFLPKPIDKSKEVA